MIRVAMYVRYSSEHQKESSITDQFRNCEQRAAREGWTITARYARSGHGGNAKLRRLIDRDPAYPNSFQFSILQITPKTISRDELLKREARLIEKLGCRAHGLN